MASDELNNLETVIKATTANDGKGLSIFQYATKVPTQPKSVLAGHFVLSKAIIIVLVNAVFISLFLSIATIISISLTKVPYGQPCTAYSQCEPTENTYCTLNGSTYICQCDSTNYWNGKLCYPKSSYNETCTSTDRCRSEFNLECANVSYGSSLTYSTYCTCTSNRTWDGSKCTMKQTYNYSCSSNAECADYLGLTCSSGICDCLPNNTKFWNYTFCETKRVYNEPCISTYWCNTATNNLYCELQAKNKTDTEVGICTCTKTQWYDTTSKICRSKYWYNTVCNTSLLQCYDSVGLICLSGVNRCRCLTTQYWTGSQCTNKKTYNVWCWSTGECNDNVGLSCQSNYCKCSSTTTFWSSSLASCISLLEIGSSCTSTSQCDYVNTYLTCSSNICQCSSTQYYDLGNTNQCVNKLTYLQTCSNNIQCDSSNYLYCQSNSKCDCNSDRYWTGSTCALRTGYLTSCTSSSSCYTYLTCRSNYCVCSSTTAYQSSTLSCVNCPSGWFGYDDRCYNAYSSDSWASARSNCESFGSNYWMAQPSSSRELIMLKSNYLSIYGNLWIGFYQPSYTCGSSWSGAHSSDSAYYNWCGGEPNCSGGGEFCAMITGSGCYNDANCGSSLYYVCEHDP